MPKSPALLGLGLLTLAFTGCQTAPLQPAVASLNDPVAQVASANEPSDAIVTAGPAEQTTADAKPAPSDESAAPATPATTEPAATGEPTEPTKVAANSEPAVKSESKSDDVADAVEHRASEKPASLAAQFDLQLLRLLQNQSSDPDKRLPADERQLLSSVVDSLDSFRHAAADEQSPLASKVQPLTELSDRLRDAEPLSIPTLALCKSVSQFGVYDPINPAEFTVGQASPVIIYCELSNFASKLGADGTWDTKLSYEAVLYSDGQASMPIINKKPTIVEDHCRNRRRDFFIADRMLLPSTLPAGKYVFKVTLIDQLGNHVAEKALPVMIAGK